METALDLTTEPHFTDSLRFSVDTSDSAVMYVGRSLLSAQPRKKRQRYSTAEATAAIAKAECACKTEDRRTNGQVSSLA